MGCGYVKFKYRVLKASYYNPEPGHRFLYPEYAARKCCCRDPYGRGHDDNFFYPDDNFCHHDDNFYCRDEKFCHHDDKFCYRDDNFCYPDDNFYYRDDKIFYPDDNFFYRDLEFCYPKSQGKCFEMSIN
jgi:hypothetical protein